MRFAWVLAACAVLCGCGSGSLVTSPAAPPVFSAVTPSATGYPLVVASWGGLEFVSVQGTGQIFTYSVNNGAQTAVGQPFAMPCKDPSGMALTNTAAYGEVMAVACYDTGQLLTLTVSAQGTLAALGSVGGLPGVFPGIAIDGSNVYVPLFGTSQGANGAVAQVSLLQPAAPKVTAVTALASPASGGFANPSFLLASGGKLYVAAGSESAPAQSSSTIQVVDEATMTLVGQPFVVAHSPQQMALLGNTLLVTLYDAGEVESISAARPDSLQMLQVLPLSGCAPLPVAVSGTTAYVGCYAQDTVMSLDVSIPSGMKVGSTLTGVKTPQWFAFSGSSLLVTSGSAGGNVTSVPIVSGGLGGKV